jgi:hypothetical protein
MHAVRNNELPTMGCHNVRGGNAGPLGRAGARGACERSLGRGVGEGRKIIGLKCVCVGGSENKSSQRVRSPGCSLRTGFTILWVPPFAELVCSATLSASVSRIFNFSTLFLSTLESRWAWVTVSATATMTGKSLANSPYSSESSLCHTSSAKEGEE